MAIDLREVKYVANYLRKSRGDEEDALDKHRLALTSLAEKHGWKVAWYEEVGSAENIDWRPEMLRLLRDVEADLFDAVLVMDLDRLSRGDIADQARWRQTFEGTGTLVITPTHVYNLAEEQTSLLADIEGVFARHEYRMITKRLRQGKVLGARQGKWTNGPAPMPYVYDAANKELRVDEAKLPVYNKVKDLVLQDIPLYKIAWQLNEEGIPSPKGGKWVAQTVHRLITSEVHLGRIVQNKTVGSAHKQKRAKPLRKRDQSEWVVSQGTHQPVKTEDEHRLILELLERRKLTAPRARNGTYVLSGMVVCGLCGSSLQFLVRPTRRVDLKKCQFAGATGKEPCPNRGCKSDILLAHIDEWLTLHEERLMQEDQTGPKRKSLEGELTLKRTELKKLETGLERIEDLFIDGEITKEERISRREKQGAKIRQKREEIARLSAVLGSAGLGATERLRRLRELKRVWRKSGVSTEDQNRALRQVIDRVVYSRVGDEVGIKIDPV